jgi:hypothetical protein
MINDPAQIADDITRGEPFDQLSPFEREWAKNIFQAALQADRVNRDPAQTVERFELLLLELEGFGRQDRTNTGALAYAHCTRRMREALRPKR